MKKCEDCYNDLEDYELPEHYDQCLICSGDWFDDDEE